MAEKQPENDAFDDDKKIIVKNLPQNCVTELLENYFESKKHFGEGIEVENVHIQDEEAIITFKKSSDVDQILQCHERKPCELVNTKLVVQSYRPCSDSDAADSGSFLLVQKEHLSSTWSGSLAYSSLKTYPSLSSVATDMSCDSSEMFGSGRSNIFSKEFSEVLLVYQQDEQENLVVKLNETDVSSVVASYAATTRAVRDIVQLTQEDTKSHDEQDKPPTILQDVMRTKFDDNVEVTTDNRTIVITRKGQIETVTNKEDFCEAVLETLKTLENHVSVKLVELDDERSELALKHFADILYKNQTIKIFSADDEFSFFIVFQTEYEKYMPIMDHIAIVSNQGIIKQEKQLPLTDMFKIEANRRMLDKQKARVRVVEHCIVIEGFKEDVNSTNTAINTILCTSHCITKTLDKFASDLLTEENIITEIDEMLKRSGKKIWWKVSGKYLNVVARNKKHASEAADMIASYFSTRRIELTHYILDFEKWKTLKKVTCNRYKNHLSIDDNSERPVVIIRGTTDACNNFASTAEDFKKENIRHSETRQMTESKCRFALNYLNTEEESFILRQGKDATELVVEATERSRQKITSRLSEISTLKFWICDDNDEKVLRSISGNKGLRVAGTIHVYENHTQIIFKTGRIENEQVDVIVNSASEDLNLNTGVNTITQSIKFAAGEQAQACLEKVKRPVQVGEVIEGDAGNMTCKAVFHAILRQYISDNNKSSIEVLKKVVNACLTKANKDGYTSIAFPALCTGVHKYPVKTVAETMFDSITGFLHQNVQSSLKKIIIVFLDSDTGKKKEFEDCKAGRVNKLVGRKGKHELSHDMPWPCRYYCHVTAATTKNAEAFAKNVIAELKEQTVVKSLGNSQ